MKICRFNDDRLGIIVHGTIRDVTAAQDEIRAAHPYVSYSDAIIAALPKWRDKLEDRPRPRIKTGRSEARWLLMRHPQQ